MLEILTYDDIRINFSNFRQNKSQKRSFRIHFINFGFSRIISLQHFRKVKRPNFIRRPGQSTKMFMIRRIRCRSVQVKLMMNKSGDQSDFILMRFGINCGLHIQGQNGHWRWMGCIRGQIDVIGQVNNGLEFAPC